MTTKATLIAAVICRALDYHALNMGLFESADTLDREQFKQQWPGERQRKQIWLTPSQH